VKQEPIEQRYIQTMTNTIIGFVFVARIAKLPKMRKHKSGETGNGNLEMFEIYFSTNKMYSVYCLLEYKGVLYKCIRISPMINIAAKNIMFFRTSE